jgi:glycerophosphoryl diester phosphodiesterase
LWIFKRFNLNPSLPLMIENFPRPILFAHRGDLVHAPENTLPAFQQALQKGADGIELDANLPPMAM